MSSTASVTLLLALATAPLLGGPGRGGHLPPLTAKYRIDQTLNQEIDATGAGAGKQVIRFTTTSYLTVRLTDSAGGKAVRAVLDSMKGDSAENSIERCGRLTSSRRIMPSPACVRRGRARRRPSADRPSRRSPVFSPWRSLVAPTSATKTGRSRRSNR